MNRKIETLKEIRDELREIRKNTELIKKVMIEPIYIPWSEAEKRQPHNNRVK